MNYQVKTIEGCAGFENTLDAVFNELEDLNLTGTPTDPQVQILFKTTGQYNSAGDVLVNATIFVGATNQDIANELVTNS
jgi:hypothetical protein